MRLLLALALIINAGAWSDATSQSREQDMFRDNTCWRGEIAYPASWVAQRRDRDTFTCADPRRDRSAQPRWFSRAAVAASAPALELRDAQNRRFYCYDAAETECYWADGRRVRSEAPAQQYAARPPAPPPINPPRAAPAPPLPATARSYASDLQTRRQEAAPAAPRPSQNAAAPRAPSAAPRPQTPAPTGGAAAYQQRVEAAIREDSGSWAYDRLVPGSIRATNAVRTAEGVTVSGTFGVTNGWMGGSTKTFSARFVGQTIRCIEFSTYAGVCSPVRTAASRRRQQQQQPPAYRRPSWCPPDDGYDRMDAC